MEHTHSAETGSRAGEQLAAVTNGIVKLFRDYYGRGPTKAKSYLLDDRIVVCVLEETMTTVERTLADNGHGDKVREVRLKFQEVMAAEFMGVVSEAMSGRCSPTTASSRSIPSRFRVLRPRLRTIARTHRVLAIQSSPRPRFSAALKAICRKSEIVIAVRTDALKRVVRGANRRPA